MAHPEIEALMHARADAMRDKDIDRVMALYAPEIVYFDLVPPLRYDGAAALRARFTDWFGRWESAIGQELHDLNVLASGVVAAAHMLIRTSGVLNEGREVAYYVRVSNACRRAGSTWLITHEHVSLPVDMASGKAVTDLAP